MPAASGPRGVDRTVFPASPPSVVAYEPDTHHPRYQLSSSALARPQFPGANRMLRACSLALLANFLPY